MRRKGLSRLFRRRRDLMFNFHLESGLRFVRRVEGGGEVFFLYFLFRNEGLGLVGFL